MSDTNKKIKEIIENLEDNYLKEEEYTRKRRQLMAELDEKYNIFNIRQSNFELLEKINSMLCNNKISLNDLPITIRIKNPTLYIYAKRGLRADDFKNIDELISLAKSDIEYCKTHNITENLERINNYIESIITEKGWYSKNQGENQ
ncbi:MAG: hypothetical protein LBM93_14940 [Oscillospiraceae bacterium]|jgi:hypothetical protein|nr:hypothetical protein [Oscillospiraceae bacterium]